MQTSLYLFIALGVCVFFVGLYFYQVYENKKSKELEEAAKLKRLQEKKPIKKEINLNKSAKNNGIMQDSVSTNVKKKPIGWTSVKSYSEDTTDVKVEKYMSKEASQSSNANKVLVKSKPIVLLVDDSITIRKYVGNILVKSNFDVVLKTDGLEAINYLKDMKAALPDLIISDIEMPNMTGDVFITELRKQKKFQNIPVIVISAHAEKHLGLMELELIQGFMHKPFDEGEFKEQIRYVMN